MPETYQLPCPNCSETIPVVTKMAGQTISCQDCDNSVEVPPMREIRRLEPLVENDTDSSQIKQRSSKRSETGSWLFSSGLLLAGIATLAAVSLWLYANSLQTESTVQEDIEFVSQQLTVATPGTVWSVWSEMKETGLPEWQETVQTRYNKQAKILKTIAYGIGVLSALGLIMMIGSFFAQGKK